MPGVCVYTIVIASAESRAEAHLERYRRLLDVVEAAALRPERSRDLIHAIAQNL
jgi:hypothetical protein